MTAVRILVVRPESVSLEDFNADFNAMGITVDGVAPEDVSFTHLVVEAGETPDTVHERVEAEVQNGDFDLVYVVEDGDSVIEGIKNRSLL